jgi:hypothetical protein
MFDYFRGDERYETNSILTSAICRAATIETGSIHSFMLKTVTIHHRGHRGTQRDLREQVEI